MASFTETTLDTTAETLNNGEFGLIADGGELVVDGADAITGSGDNRLIVNGILGATSVNNLDHSAYEFDGSTTDVFVGLSGLVFSASGTALDLVGSSTMKVVNNGSILADNFVVQADNSDGSALIIVTNNGFMSGVFGISIDTGSFSGFVTNTGVISTLNASVQSLGSGNIELINSGTMVSANSLAIILGIGNDTLINTGTITGAINLGGGDDLFDGHLGIQATTQSIALGAGDDTFIGGVGDELIFGQSGDDDIRAGGGNDTIRGDNDLGNDTYDGGDGVDVVNYGGTFTPVAVNLSTGFATGGFVGLDQLVSIENVTTSTAADTVVGSSDNNLIRTGAGNDRAFGEEGRDRLRGGQDNDTLNGGDGNDLLFGEEDDDRLFGDNGNDFLVGGLGRDVMTGGADNDTFAFFDIADSGTTGGTRDRITDFDQGSDKIDLSAIDADLLSASDDAFTFIGTGAFTATAGEVRFRQSATLTIVEADQDGDGVADLEIRLDGVINLVANDFVL